MAVRVSDSIPPVRLARAAVAALVVLAAPAVAGAQTTLTLSAPGTQLTDDVTIRGGGYASVSYAFDDTLTTKTSADVSNVRRALLKFDTSNTIPAGTTITSAKLTLTLKSAGSAASRRIGVFWVNQSFLKDSANWTNYRTNARWAAGGGDLGSQLAYADVGNAPGLQVTFDLTTMVQQAVNNAYGTRWTRLALVDVSAADNNSLRAFYSSRASDPNVRPKLVVTWGAAAPAPAPEPSPSPSPTPQPVQTGSTTSLRVMTYNTHHGEGEDGVYNLSRIADVIVSQNPDVVSLNEVMYNSSYGNGENQPETYKRLLEQKTGQSWQYVYARMDGNWNSTSWSVGDMLLSRIPFTSTSRYSLSASHAVAQGALVVNGRTINVFSSHVAYDNNSLRTQEITQLNVYDDSWCENRVIMGDFNTNPGTSDYNKLVKGYTDLWKAGWSAGIATSPSGSSGYTHGYSRFDYILQSQGAANLAPVSVVVPNTGVSGKKPSDHDPVVVTFKVN